jgi:hypothetical protein
MPSRTASSLNRRRFLQGTAAAGTAVLGAPAFLRGENLNSKLNIAMIGSGGRGGHNLKQVESENIVALCDVFQPAIDMAAQRHAQARKYTDFRKLLDNSKDVDAVIVSTCEHTHAFATLGALQLGKHVYCEKPLTHDIWEARVIREAAAKAKVATQMGIQIHATNNYRRVVEMIQSGVIGPVSEAHVWVSRAWGRQSEADAKANQDRVYVEERPTGTSKMPEGLDWELWLGPAPYRPFHEVYFPGPKWYRWWDFGNGTMSDLGSHWVDLPFWALKLEAPLTIEASGPPPHAEIAPASMQVAYEYGARGSLPPVRLTWYQGTNKPAAITEKKIPAWGNGVLFVGTKGMLVADYQKYLLLPEKDFAGYQPPEPTLPRTESHHVEWLNACKNGTPTLANFEYSGWLTEANHLGNVAYRAGKKLQWDPASLRATNCPEAQPFIQRDYREGWRLA